MSDDKLALLADTKETLRLTLGLRKDVPFSQYASHIPYYLKAGTVFDFVNNQYSKDQLPANLNDISEFIRLSSATEWQNGKLVEVANNVPRNSGEGWLVEEQRTNLYPQNVLLGNFYKPDLVTTVIDGPNPEFGKFIHVKGRGSTIAPSGTIPAQGGRSYTLSVYSYNPAPITVHLSNEAGGSYVKTVVTPVGGGLYRHTRPTFVAPEGGSTIHPHFKGVAGHTLGWIQVEEGEFPTSYIPTEGTPATRSPEILNIPLLPSQTITGDWDDGVTYTDTDGIATFTGHGYLRNITVVDDPLYLLLFKGGEKGAWYDPSDLRTLFQDAAGTTPVTTDGDPVGLMLDKSGNGHHVIQAVSAARPVYRTDGGLHWLQFDGVDDVLETADALPSGLGSTLFLGARLGLGDNNGSVTIFGWNVLAGATSVSSASISMRPSRVNVGSARARVGAGTSFAGSFPQSEFNKTLGAVWYVSWDESPTVTSLEVNLSGVNSTLSGGTYAGITQKIGINGNLQPVDFFGGVVLGSAPSSEVRILTSKYIANLAGITL